MSDSVEKPRQERSQDLVNQELTNPSQEDVAALPEAEDVAASPPGKEDQSALSLDDIGKLIEAQPDAEAKLALAVMLLEKTISQAGLPQFRTFWELRKQCQALLRENISPMIRAKLWARFNELSEEGRRLKEMLDEQSAFAAEQIEMAIKGLESDLEQFPQLLDRTAGPQLPTGSRALEGEFDTYHALQTELNLLNTCATRVNALRKELIKTDMRIGQKNKFFQRLSAAGDRIFPRRKELIKDVSHRFLVNIDSFLSGTEEILQQPHGLRFLREEIKSLQLMAKALSLNTQSFNRTRQRLSESWDKMKEVEKVQRQERSKEKAGFREKAQELYTQMEEFKDTFRKGEVSIDAAKQQVDQLFSGMRALVLARDELNALQEGLREARQLVVDRVKSVERERYQLEADREKQRLFAVHELGSRITQLLTANEGLSSVQMTAESTAIGSEMEKVRLTRDEKIAYERELRPVRDLIIERREQELLSLSSDDLQALQQLREVLRERQTRRLECRKQLEIYRKAGGASGSDFEQALLFNAQVAEERARLERIEDGIEEVEDKIYDLEQKI